MFFPQLIFAKGASHLEDDGVYGTNVLYVVDYSPYSHLLPV